MDLSAYGGPYWVETLGPPLRKKGQMKRAPAKPQKTMHPNPENLFKVQEGHKGRG